VRDQELIRRVIERRPGAFDEFYYAYVDRVHRQLFTMVGPDAEIEDLIQLTFVQVFRRIGTFRGDASISTWLHRVAVNVALSHLRKRKRWFRWESDQQLQVPLPSAPEQPDEAFGRREKLQLLHKVLDRVKPKKRVVFLLYEVEGHTLEEIGQIVDAPVNTVAARLRAARLEVRRALERRLKASETAVA
jgi:RNA polymerase sigma-70 factor (ECF subfamily)